jgi:hypothetical protein
MTDPVFLSTAAVAIILAGVAMRTMLLTLAIGALGRPERNYTAALFGCLGRIWVGAIFVIVLIKLPDMSTGGQANFGEFFPRRWLNILGCHGLLGS